MMPPTNGTLTPFERNNYFYGLLMDVERFRKDQTFLDGKRRLVNRLVTGAGVVCGLDVVSAEPAGLVTIRPGVAIDALGREIVVPEPRTIDPRQPTDAAGQPAGPPLTTGVVELCLAYAEVKTDPVPVLVPDCDGPGTCAASTIRETHVVIVRPASAPTSPAGCTLGTLPAPAEPALHDALAKRLLAPCETPPTDPGIAIARIDLATSAIDPITGRPLVYGNQLLYELIVCLADSAGGPGPGGTARPATLLRYTSGDNQAAGAGKTLAAPLVVEAVDALGGAIPGVTVQFEVTAGGGRVTASEDTTGADGRASTKWRLGPASSTKNQEMRATASGTALTVVFHAQRR
jgi:hypothetical protein